MYNVPWQGGLYRVLAVFTENSCKVLRTYQAWYKLWHKSNEMTSNFSMEELSCSVSKRVLDRSTRLGVEGLHLKQRVYTEINEGI